MAKLKFNGGSPELKLDRSSFNLSNFTMFDCEQGQLIPTATYDCVPGDKFNLSTSSLVRTTPLIKPAYTVDLMQKTASFFVAYRTLYKDFEDFFAGGRTGNKIIPLPAVDFDLIVNTLSEHNTTTLYSVLDYFGLPAYECNPRSNFPRRDYINAFYLLAYIKIWNDYFRNPSLDIEVDVLDFSIYYPLSDDPVKASTNVVTHVFNGSSIQVLDVTNFVCACFNVINGNIPSNLKLPDNYTLSDVLNLCSAKPFSLDPFKVNLNRDLFTSALPTYSNVEPVSMGLTGSFSHGSLFNSESKLSLHFSGTEPAGGYALYSNGDGSDVLTAKPSITPSDTSQKGFLYGNVSGENNAYITGAKDLSLDYSMDGGYIYVPGSSLNNAMLAGSSSISVSGIYPRELRLVFGLDLNQQLRNLTGSRYQNLLKTFYGVTVRDYRLNLAEYIGGSRQPVYISEVLQTSESASTPLGEQAGHAIVSGYGRHGSYFVEELGCIINLFWINSTSLYTQGLRRDWRKFLLDDFFFSAFENLGDQEVFQEEIVYTFSTPVSASGTFSNDQIFGFCPRYSEYKFYNDTVVGGFRGNYRYWTQARIFGIEDITGTLSGYPVLSPEFIKADFRQNNRIFQTIDADYTLKPFLVKFENKTIAFRPFKQSSVGYLIDHF